jgi:hypothetical protein
MQAGGIDPKNTVTRLARNKNRWSPPRADA